MWWPRWRLCFNIRRPCDQVMNQTGFSDEIGGGGGGGGGGKSACVVDEPTVGKQTGLKLWGSALCSLWQEDAAWMALAEVRPARQLGTLFRGLPTSGLEICCGVRVSLTVTASLNTSILVTRCPVRRLGHRSHSIRVGLIEREISLISHKSSFQMSQFLGCEKQGSDRWQ